ncbi:Uncharacterised protein [Amycolatopsis camponoti]|uniref:Uncharacterized protein n=1 Tax=Amycolatopsis camponoti TaxID=2606593 RepID=A0A6I8LRA2_9PSEU|nr:hypothetical protein [Amycolatopsis camponoti]VVJ19610.1 Uncharacterised protein [Amycolatopsis camponoti]
MTPLAEHLADPATEGAVPALTQLGAEAVADEAGDIAAGPLAPMLARALAAVVDTAPDEWHAATASFIEGMSGQESLLALASSLDELLSSPSTVRVQGTQLSNALLRDLTPLIHANPLLAAGRLEGAVRLAVAGATPPFGVLGHLTASPPSAPEEFTERLPRLLGAAIDRWANEETIAAALRAALDQLRHDAAAGVDAAFEIACWRLRSALTAETLSAAMDALTAARSDFATVDAAEEGRHDAQAYAAACDALLAFAAQDHARLVDANGRLTTALDQRVAWLSGMNAPTWLQPRRAAELAWRRLALVLGAAADRLAETVWMDVWDALATVVDAYAQARTARPLPGLDAVPGLTAVVEPAIENAIMRQQSLLAALRRSVSELSKLDTPPLDATTAELLLTRIETAATGSRASHTRSPRPASDGDDDEEPHPVDTARLYRLAPSLVHILGERQAADVANDIADDKLQVLEGIVHSTELARSRTAHPILDRLLEALLQQLAQSPDFVGDVRDTFGLLLEQTLLFLLSRADLTTKTWGMHKKDNDYRRVLKGGDTRPLEADLQQDFHQWLQTGPLSGLVAVERIDIALGRADVIVTFGTIRYLIEIKREFTDSTPESLEDKYLHQAAEYSNTNVPFGQLLVLDLTPHPDGAPRLDESVWLARHRPPGATKDRMVVVGVVAGNRLTPSDLSS